jgi:hypothetical protein
MPRLLGGGAPQRSAQAEEKDEATQMGIAAGGGIKQVIRRDFHPADIWDKDKVIIFNIQILNASAFYKITTLPPPSTPINANTYA